MNESAKNTPGTAPYKGVRDFYPEDMQVLTYLFSGMRKSAESFGYQEFNASILEPAELYQSKTSEEIVNEQTYSFIDRGGREVVLRPEMTPTAARMVAARRRELSYPLRWYSIPNVFRYERPQRGRLREHWQLNVDLFGASGVAADAEVIALARQLLKNFGLADSDFQIKINDKTHTVTLLQEVGVESVHHGPLMRLLDKKSKLSAEEFEKNAREILGERTDTFLSVFSQTAPPDSTTALIAALRALGITATYDAELVRGFEYYTSTVFEIFDTHPENRRSLFGGGRYDELLRVFNAEPIPAVGFGMGDVTLADALSIRNLLPEYASATDLYICVLGEHFSTAQALAQRLRERGISVAVDLTGKKVSEQIKKADKDNIPYILCIGEEEMVTGSFKVKDLRTGKEEVVTEERIPTLIKEA